MTSYFRRLYSCHTDKLFDVLGVNLSTAEKKNADFAKVFCALGVSLICIINKLVTSFKSRTLSKGLEAILSRSGMMPVSGPCMDS